MARRPLSEEDKQLLKAAMKDVVPLSKKPVVEKAAVALPRKRCHPPEHMQAELPTPTPSKGSIDKATAKKVARGEYAIDAKLDLHGLTLSQAHTRLAAFIEAEYRQQSRCLLVITGKSGELVREVPRWLALSALAQKILVVSSAQPKHGGQGAHYVLLRRHKI